MAKMIPNPAAGELRGRIGDLVFVKHKNGEIIVRKRPVRKVPRRKGELRNQKEFTDSVVYAKAVWAEQPELKARYNAVAQAQGRQGFNLAKSDFRTPPTVEDIELDEYTGKIGEVIRIQAVDDFEVKSVRVVIRDLEGVQVEQGNAVLEDGKWAYRGQSEVSAGQTVTIEVTATDHPGHTAVKPVDHACGPRK
jgi:hypothetical protein